MFDDVNVLSDLKRRFSSEKADEKALVFINGWINKTSGWKSKASVKMNVSKVDDLLKL